ncbi:MAG: hypothetical protein HW416_227 [Chloroflexi bacterium]|nr:hypothetical protein [Chloroflexota bacterium]
MARLAIPTTRYGPAPVPSRMWRPDVSRLPSLALSWIATAVLFVAAAVGLYLIQVSSLATGGYELQRLQSERDGWVARNQQMEFELAKRRSLPWVEAEAAQRLGMARSDQPSYINVQAPQVGAERQAALPCRRDLGSSCSLTGRAVSSASARAASTEAPTGTSFGAPSKPQLPGNPTSILAALRDWVSLLTVR